MIVRLRNWIGDVVLGLPALELLRREGYELQLVGKPWAASLLSGTGWSVTPLGRTGRERSGQLRALAQAARLHDPGFDRRLNAVVFPFSFSSALEARWAGLKAIGYRYEARSWLLHRALDLPQGVHEIHRYWALACATLGRTPDAPPSRIHLPLASQALEGARSLRERHGLEDGYLMLCPFAGGLLAGQSRHWPNFAALAQALSRAGHRLVMCPGPKEAEAARRDFPQALVLEDVALDVYAALIAQARIMVSNDTGPGHMAATVGTPLVSILGPTLPEQWRAWGEAVEVVRVEGGWPEVGPVRNAVDRALEAARA